MVCIGPFACAPPLKQKNCVGRDSVLVAMSALSKFSSRNLGATTDTTDATTSPYKRVDAEEEAGWLHACDNMLVS